MNFQLNSSLISYSDGSSSINFGALSGLEYVSDGGSNEFIVLCDYGANRLIKFDMNFNFIKSVSVASPSWITSSSDSIYVNSNHKPIIRYNFNLTQTGQIDCTKVCGSSACCFYTSVFYRKDTNQLYLAEQTLKKVYSSDSRLTTLTETASFSSITVDTCGLTYFNGRIFVGSANNQIITIQDGSLTQTPYNNICAASDSYIASIYVYKMKYILVNCNLDKKVTILNLDLSYTGYYLSTPSAYGRSFGITFDGKRLFVTTYQSSSINIFTSTTTTTTPTTTITPTTTTTTSTTTVDRELTKIFS